MSQPADASPAVQALCAAVREAHERGTPLAIRGSGSKGFYGRPVAGEALDVTPHAGVLRYEPAELVLTARAGTPLAEIEDLLAANNQMLAFEPPHFGPGATLGGTIACGFSGPRRATHGAARDFVLGVRLIDGRGRALRFGGEVMKNVAGYDVSRLMVGALGTLGVLTEVSLKVLPRPAAETTLRFECGEALAIETMNRWLGRPLPLSALAWVGGALWVRLSGAEAAVRAAAAALGGEAVGDATSGAGGLEAGSSNGRDPHDNRGLQHNRGPQNARGLDAGGPDVGGPDVGSRNAQGPGAGAWGPGVFGAGTGSAGAVGVEARDPETLGAEAMRTEAVRSRTLRAEAVDGGAAFWRAAREQTAPFFARDDLPLWRLSVPSAAPPLALPGRQALTWAGAQRWLKSDADAASVRAAAAQAGGHASLFRAGATGPEDAPFPPLPAALAELHLRLKRVFDPQGILNPGRLHAGL